MKNIEETIKLMYTLAKGFGIDVDDVVNQLKSKKEYKPTRWRAEKGGTYFHITHDGLIIEGKDNYSGNDSYYYKSGNYYKTLELAKKVFDKQLLIQEIWDFAGSQEWIDWENLTQRKYCLFFEYDTKVWNWEYVVKVQFQFILPHFKSGEECKECIQHFGDRLNILKDK